MKNKKLYVLSLVVSILSLVISIFTLCLATDTGPRLLKNYYGHLVGYSGCPNCGDTWNWKPGTKGVMYKPSKGIRICDECLKDRNFDYDKIRKTLFLYRWEKEDMEKAIKELKTIR